MASRCLGVNKTKAPIGRLGVLEKICVTFPKINRQRIKSELEW